MRKNLFVLAAVVAAAVVTSVPQAAAGVSSIDVRFAVINRNTSKVPCPSDGQRYEVAGHIVGPARGVGPTTTLYLHGGTGGEWLWHLTSLPDYDFAADMARRGHTLVVIDRLGFGRSGHPHGNELCVGSEADVVDQIVRALKNGSYRTDVRRAPVFTRVAVAGLSQGGFIAETHAWSFGTGDALILTGAGPVGPNFIQAMSPFAEHIASVCASGGEPANFDGSGPTGYVYEFGTFEAANAVVFHDVSPEVVAAIRPLQRRDPCGFSLSFLPLMAVRTALVSTVRVPVLLIDGEHDPFVTPDDNRNNATSYGSTDVSVVIVPDTGHVPLLERAAPIYRAELSKWLTKRGF